MVAGWPANDAAWDGVLCNLVLGDLRRGDLARVVGGGGSSTAGAAGKPDATATAAAKSPARNGRAKSNVRDAHTSKHASKIRKKKQVGPSQCQSTVTESAPRVRHSTNDCLSRQKKTVRHSHNTQ